MLTVAVTGGIGAGKSTVAQEWAGRGAVVIDSDRLAREVVAPGTPGLTEIATAFGPGVLTGEGKLDRAALAAIVFADPAGRARLEAITHPRVRARFAQLRAAASRDAVVVNDIPLLTGLSAVAEFHLVTGVHADEEVRVARLRTRGLSEADARARMSAQLTDAHRRPLCDVWLDNNGPPSAVREQARRVFDERIIPFRDRLLTGRAAESDRMRPAARSAPEARPDPGGDRMAEIARQRARVCAATEGAQVEVLPGPGSQGLEVGLIELRVHAPDPAAAARWAARLSVAGFFPAPPGGGLRSTPGGTRTLRAADPGVDLTLYLTLAR